MCVCVCVCVRARAYKNLKKTSIYLSIYLSRGSLTGVEANVMECDLVVSEFELQRKPLLGWLNFMAYQPLLVI